MYSVVKFSHLLIGLNSDFALTFTPHFRIIEELWVFATWNFWISHRSDHKHGWKLVSWKKDLLLFSFLALRAKSDSYPFQCIILFPMKHLHNRDIEMTYDH